MARLNIKNLKYIAQKAKGKLSTIERGGISASNFIKINSERFRSSKLKSVPGSDKYDLWLYFLVAGLMVIMMGVSITKF